MEFQIELENHKGGDAYKVYHVAEAGRSYTSFDVCLIQAPARKHIDSLLSIDVRMPCI